MGKKQREARRRKNAGKAAAAQTKHRPWLLPVLVFLGALAFIGLALVAAGDR